MPSLQSEQELRHTIGLYGPAFQPVRWPPASATAGFSGASVYQYRAANQNYALRIWPASERSIPKLESLTRLLEDFHRQGITYVAPAVRKTDGTVATISTSGRMIHIEPWLPGESIAANSFSPQKLKNIMLALARLHLTAANHVPNQVHYLWIRPAYTGQSASLKYRLKKMEQHLKTGIPLALGSRSVSEEAKIIYQRLQTVFRSQAALLWEELKIASQQNLPLQPVFKDVWRDHILFLDDEVTGIIDPGAFGCDSVLTDITRLLGSIAGNDWNRWNEAIAIYQTIRPLNQTEQKMLAVFDHSNLLLSAIGCFEKYMSPSFASASDQFSASQQTRLSSRLEEYLNRLESYQNR